MNTIRKFILLPVVLNLFDAVINKTTSATTGNDLSSEMKTFYSDYLIDMAEPLLVHDPVSYTHLYQPSHSGRPQQASTGEKMDALRDLHDEFSGL